MTFNIYALFSFLAFLVGLGLSGYIYSRNPYSILNKVFILFLLLVTVWSGAETMSKLSTSESQAAFWLRVAALGWVLMAPLFLIFAVIFTRNEHILNYISFFFLLFAPAITFLFLVWRTNWLITYEFEQFFWGWRSPVGRYFLIFAIWITIIFLTSFALFIRFYLRTRIKEEKLQVKLILLAIFFPFLVGMVGQVIIPLFGESSFLLEAIIFPFTSITLALFLSYAILRYKLFIISPAQAYSSIIETMSEALIVLTPTNFIELVNKATSDLLGYSKQELIGENIERIIAPGKVFQTFKDRAILPLRQGKSVKNLETKFLTKDAKEIPINFSASIIKGPGGEPVGVVGVGVDITQTKNLIKKLEDTIKELNIVRYNLERKISQITA